MGRRLRRGGGDVGLRSHRHPRPRAVPAASRQAHGRIQLHQRPGVLQGHPGGLRRVGRARLARVVIRQRAAVLQKVGDGPHLRAGRFPRRRRPHTRPPLLQRGDDRDTQTLLGDLHSRRIPGIARPEPSRVGRRRTAPAQQRGRRPNEYQPDLPFDGAP